MKKNFILILCVVIIIILASLTACQTITETEAVNISGPATTITTTTGISWLDITIYQSLSDSSTITVDIGKEFGIALYTALMAEGLWSATYEENMLNLLANKYLDYFLGGRSLRKDSPKIPI